MNMPFANSDGLFHLFLNAVLGFELGALDFAM
jgi:hypothetical protein